MRERENLRWVFCCCLFTHIINNTRTRAYFHVLCERPPAGRPSLGKWPFVRMLVATGVTAAFVEAVSCPRHPCTRDARCSCDCIKARCPADVHVQTCTRAAPFLHAREDPRVKSQIKEVASALGRALERSAGLPCIWDDTEVLLKASVYSDERVLITGWVLAWLRSLLAARTCAPRLHVVSDLQGRYLHALLTYVSPALTLARPRLTHSPNPRPRPEPLTRITLACQRKRAPSGASSATCPT